MIALDASVLIAHFSPDDAHHEAATALLLTTGKQRLLMHTVTMAEVLVGAVRAHRGEQMRTDIRGMGIELATHDADEPLRLAHLRATTPLKMPDCCVLDVAITNGAMLATYDHVLAREAGQHNIQIVA